ncbi:MAG: LolA family protein [Terracidiphilus sp.]
MHRKGTFVFLALLAAALLPVRQARAGDLASVLEKLDAAAKDFHTTSATVEFKTIQTDPVPDTDIQQGTAYYQRSGTTFQMAGHITDHNNRPSDKTYILSRGVLRISETGKEADAKTITQASKYEGYLMLGFGASGRQLAEKWDIQYLGAEKIDGIVTDKLELVAKDPAVRKNIAKVTVWMDTARAVSLKVIFDEGEGQSWVCHYTNIKVNQPLPVNAFGFDK